VETLAQGFYRTNLLFGGRERNQTDYLIEITNIRKTIHAHAMAGAQCTFKEKMPTSINCPFYSLQSRKKLL